MWLCCCTCCNNDEGIERTPLLTHHGRPMHSVVAPNAGTVNKQNQLHHQKRYQQQQQQQQQQQRLQQSNTVEQQPRNNSNSMPPTAARRHNIQPIDVKTVGVRHIDKQFQDHALLFNTHLERLDRVLNYAAELAAMFADHNPEHTIEGALMITSKLCSGCESVTVTKSNRHCWQASYDGREVPSSVIPVFITFNAVNTLIQGVVDCGPSLVSSLQLVLQGEAKLNRDILVASLGDLKSQASSHCAFNLSQMQAAIENVEMITKTVLEVSKQLQTFRVSNDGSALE